MADTEIEVDGTEGCIRALINLKQREPLLKVILTIGGGGLGSAKFARVAADPTRRHIFARSAADLVRQYDFDGVDSILTFTLYLFLFADSIIVDWEHPSSVQEGNNYIHLLAATRNLLPAPRYILTTALPAGEWVLQYINLGVASTYVDFINLMGYDFSGPWSNLSGHQAQLYSPLQPHDQAASLSCHSAVAYIAQRGVPLFKILLGIPVFGRSFLNATNIGQTYEGSGGVEGTFDYRDLPRPGTQEYVDTDVGAAYCVGGDGGFVSYDNPRTVQMKANYAREFRLGGLFYWTGTGDARGTRSLVRTGYNTLHNL